MLYNFSNPLDQQQRQIKTKHGLRKPWTILHLSKVLCIKEIVFSHITKAFAVFFTLRNCFFRKPLIFASIIRLLFFLKKAKHWPVCILGQRVSILEQTPVFLWFSLFWKKAHNLLWRGLILVLIKIAIIIPAVFKYTIRKAFKVMKSQIVLSKLLGSYTV